MTTQSTNTIKFELIGAYIVQIATNNICETAKYLECAPKTAARIVNAGYRAYHDMRCEKNRAL